MTLNILHIGLPSTSPRRLVSVDVRLSPAVTPFGSASGQSTEHLPSVPGSAFSFRGRTAVDGVLLQYPPAETQFHISNSRRRRTSHFEDEETRLVLRLRLDRVDVQIICRGNPDDVALPLPPAAKPAPLGAPGKPRSPRDRAKSPSGSGNANATARSPSSPASANAQWATTAAPSCSASISPTAWPSSAGMTKISGSVSASCFSR